METVVKLVTNTVIEDVQDELARQIEQFGFSLDTDSGNWLAILVEEVGEVAQTLLKFKDTDKQCTYGELIQVAAVAISWARAIECNSALRGLQ